ncbi:hypothetical protein BGZ65_002635, partial [Modicella reniformis]
MKTALNIMLKAGVDNPTVVGLLVSGYVLEALTLNLDFEALNVPKSVGTINLPTDRTDLSRIADGLRILQTVK